MLAINDATDIGVSSNFGRYYHQARRRRDATESDDPLRGQLVSPIARLTNTRRARPEDPGAIRRGQHPRSTITDVLVSMRGRTTPSHRSKTTIPSYLRPLHGYVPRGGAGSSLALNLWSNFPDWPTAWRWATRRSPINLSAESGSPRWTLPTRGRPWRLRRVDGADYPPTLPSAPTRG